jgi:hypothetical protein
MISPESVRKLALAYPEVEELGHFEKPSFRIKKKIFTTLHVEEKRAVLKLNPVDQSVFCDYKEKIFFKVPGAWGKQGWTIVDLKKVRQNMFADALSLSFKQVAPKSIFEKVF